MAVQGICWAKMFHLRVDEVEPSVCVNAIVSAANAPNSTYTGKVKVIRNITGKVKVIIH